MSAEPNITRYSKTQHKPHTKAGQGDPVEGKGPQEEVTVTPTTTVRSPTRYSSYTTVTYTLRT